MALVAHYPLNHDNKNYGISNVPYDDTETTFVKGGKIGKCYYQKKTVQQSRYYIEELDGIRTFSIGMWINFDQNPDWSRAISLGTAKDGVTHPSVLRFESSYTAQETSSQFGIYNSPYYTIMQPNLGACSKKTKYGEWHHFIFTTDGSTCRFYKNGVEIGNCENIGGHLTGYIYFGNADTTGTNCNCKLNDIRIYNHCLSDSEIKEIYKTPILKYSFDYPLTDPTISTANNPNVTWTSVTNNYKTMGQIIYDKEYVIDDQCFTISFDIEIKDIIGVDGAKTAMGIQDNTILNGETSSKWSTIINTNEIYGRANQFASNDGTREIDLRKNGKYHISRTYKITNTSRFKQNWNIQIKTDNITGGVAKVSNFRVVLGKKEIPYDGTDGIIYDESGMGNNGVLIADDKSLKTTYSTDAKIGEGCYVCDVADVDGNLKYSVIETENNFDELNEFTISFWVCMSDYSYVESATFLAHSANPSDYSIWIRYEQGNSRVVSQLFGNSTHTLAVNNAIERNKWTHIVITAKKNELQKIYINGEQKVEGSLSGSVDWQDAPLTVTDLRKNRRLRFDGKMDDLRIYATVLESDEVKRMYMERARVDSKGNLYCNELVESPYKIDYIRSDGNQYIDTEIIGDYDTKIEIKVGSLEVPNRFSALYGSRINNTNQFWAYIDSAIDNSIYFRRLTNSYGIRNFDWNSTHIITQDKDGVTIDGEKKLTYTTMSEFPNPQNLYLFNVDNYQQPQSDYGIRMNLYYCKIWKNNEIVRDFIPAISNEVGHMNEVCLYDLVTNRYFYNLSGVGEFVMNEPHLDMLATNEVKINEKGIVNCAILNEGKSIAKIIHKNSIFETNQINEN